jgi:hypothetical protein
LSFEDFYFFQTIVMSFRVEARNWYLAQAFGKNFSNAVGRLYHNLAETYAGARKVVHKRPANVG